VYTVTLRASNSSRGSCFTVLIDIKTLERNLKTDNDEGRGPAKRSRGIWGEAHQQGEYPNWWDTLTAEQQEDIEAGITDWKLAGKRTLRKYCQNLFPPQSLGWIDDGRLHSLIARRTKGNDQTRSGSRCKWPYSIVTR